MSTKLIEKNDSHTASLYTRFAEAMEKLPDRTAELLMAHLEDPVLRRVGERLGLTERQVMTCKGHPAWPEALRLARELRFRDHDRSEVIDELRCIAFSDPTEYKFDDQGRPIVEPGKEHIWRAVRSVERIPIAGMGAPTFRSKITFWDKGTALKLLAQCYGYLEQDVKPGDEKPSIVVIGVDMAAITGDKKVEYVPPPRLVEARDSVTSSDSDLPAPVNLENSVGETIVSTADGAP